MDFVFKLLEIIMHCHSQISSQTAQQQHSWNANDKVWQNSAACSARHWQNTFQQFENKIQLSCIMYIKHVEYLKQIFHAVCKAWRLVNVHSCAIQLDEILPVNAQQDWLPHLPLRHMRYCLINCHTLHNTIRHTCTKLCTGTAKHVFIPSK